MDPQPAPHTFPTCRLRAPPVPPHPDSIHFCVCASLNLSLHPSSPSAHTPVVSKPDLGPGRRPERQPGVGGRELRPSLHGPPSGGRLPPSSRCDPLPLPPHAPALELQPHAREAGSSFPLDLLPSPCGCPPPRTPSLNPGRWVCVLPPYPSPSPAFSLDVRPPGASPQSLGPPGLYLDSPPWVRAPCPRPGREDSSCWILLALSTRSTSKSISLPAPELEPIFFVGGR